MEYLIGYTLLGFLNFTFGKNKTVSRLELSYSDICTCELSNIQLEEGKVATPYEPYQEDKLTILSPTPLEKVGGVADRIICKDGVYGVEKNVIDTYLNHTDAWSNVTEKDGYVYTYRSKSIGTSAMCNVLPMLTSSEWNSRRVKGLYCTSLSLGICIPTSELEGVNSVSVNNWIKSNNVIVKVANTQHQFIPLPHDQQIKLRTFANKTHIHFDTEIEPTLKAQVPKSLGATVNTHTTQIDNLNKELDRVKKLEESTVSTVTSSKAFTTIAETSGGYFEDVKIEGKTLVNKYLQPTTNSYETTDKVVFAHDRGYILNVKHCYDVRGWDKTITVISTTGKPIYLEWLTLINDDTTVKWGGTLNNSFIVQSFVLPEECSSITIGGYKKEGWTLEKATSSNIVILEGDHTDKDLSYFEGLKSVGQDSDEIEILSNNKNLFDVTKLQIKGNSRYGYMYLGESNEYTISITDKDISVDMSDVYFGFTGNGKDADNNVHWVMDYGKVKLTKLTSYGDLKYFSFYPKNQETLNKITSRFNVQIEEGSVATSYVPHQSNKKQILYYNPTTQTWEKPVLREWDSIEKHSDGKYYYHKRSREIIFDGSSDENWYPDGNTELNCKFRSLLYSDIKGYTISDRFNTTTWDIYNVASGEEFLINGSNGINVTILKTKLSTQDVDGFKAWLQANPVTVVYELAQEEVYECTNLDLITYQNETNLIISSGAIQPRITLKVLSNVSNVVKLLQEKVSILENKFINGLKQVLAGDMLSLAHLLYPEDFENNHEIQTLEL